MEHTQQAQKILYDSYIKLALVNLDTGEYVSLISLDKGAEDYGSVADAAAYFRGNKALERCHPDDVYEFERMCDLSYIKELADRGATSIVRNFRWKLSPDEEYTWIEVDVEMSRAGGGWALFGVRRICREVLAFEDSIKALTKAYHRIFRINIEEDHYDIIRDNFTTERVKAGGSFFDGYMRDLFANEDIYPEDAEKVRACMNAEFLADFFSAGHDRLSMRYRRKTNLVYRWVMTEVIPTAEYRDNNKVLYFYIRDIHEEYSASIQKEELLKFYSYKDALTHLANRNSFSIVCDAYAEKKNRPPVGFIFNDVNKLKYVNDNFGHKEGDLYLQRVAQLLAQQFGENACYRISGDEFVVVFIDISEEKFNAAVSRYRGVLAEEGEPPVAVGAVWKQAPESIDQLMDEAEKRMYEDKLLFYSQHPEVKRRVPTSEGAVAFGSKPELAHRNLGRTDRIFDALAATTLRNYMFMVDVDTNVTKWSASAVDYFGLPGQYIYDTEKVWTKLIHPDDRAIFDRDMVDVFAGRKNTHDVEYRVKNKNGEYVVCTCRAVVTKKPNGNPEFFVGTIINHGIIDGVDPVTGLHNQQEYARFLKNQIAKRQGFAVLAVGISMFNNINMMYGYAYGNETLKSMAGRLKELVGGRGLLFRLEGARFAVCSMMYTEPELNELYGRIQNLASENVGADGAPTPLAVYGGAYICDHAGVDEDTVKSSIEYVLERSADDRHGELVFVGDEVKDDDRLLLRMYSVIHRSVLHGMEGFYMCYQPIADSVTGTIVGMEALLRWSHPDYGVVSPGAYIPWLEQEPCFFRLGNCILRQSLADAGEIRKQHPEFVVNVNVAATQLEHHGFREAVMDILKETGYPADHLCLELTERCWNMDIEYLRGELEFFRSLGIRIALDDFGTGNSTLNLLSRLPVDELKVDMSFVRGIRESKANQVVVEAVMSCAHALGYKSCIEGVEDKELFDYLQRYGSTYYQGYHFSKPVPIEAFKTLVQPCEKEAVC